MAAAKQPNQRALKRIRLGTVTPYQPSPPPSWSLESIKSALRQHLSGDLKRSSQLYRALGSDDEIPSSRRKLAQSILRCPFSLELTDPSAEESEQVEAGEYLATKILPDAQLQPLINDYDELGVAVGTLDWVTTVDEWYPRLRRLDPEFLWYDGERRVWTYSAREGQLEVTPGDGLWFLWTDGERGFETGLIRALGPLWYAKQIVLRDWDRYNERHGLPIIAAGVPMSVEKDEKTEFIDDLQKLGAEGIIGLPKDTDEWQSFSLELLEAKDTAWATYQSRVDRCDRKIQTLKLGGNLQSEVASTGANRAASETHADQLDRIRAGAIAKSLGEALQTQVMRQWVDANWGTEIEAPYPCWQTEPPEDRREQSLSLQALGLALNMIRIAGYKVENLEELTQGYGIELAEDEAAIAARAQPSGSPGAGGPPRGAEFAKQRLLERASALLLDAGGDEKSAVRGVLQTDDGADDLTVACREAMTPDARTLMRIVASAQSRESLITGIEQAFAQSNPSRLADIIEKALILAELEGRWSVDAASR